MSDETWQALEQAAAAHAVDEADREGCVLTTWVLTAAVASIEDMDETVYVTASSSGPLHHRIGLVRYLSLRTEALARREGD